MSSEPIDIEVRDKVSTTVRDKLLNIASAALEGANSVDKLNAMLDKIDGGSITKLVKAQADLEKQTVKNNLSYLQQETALNKAIAAETLAETAAQKLTTASLQSEAAQLKAAAAAAKTAQASTAAAQAVNAFGETEADVAARLNAVGQAGAALAKQQQSIAITAAQATTAEAGLARATTASATAAQGAAARYSNYMSALNTLNKSSGGTASVAGVASPAAVNASTEALNKNAFATAGVTRELIVLGHEAVSGNFSRIPGSLLVLTERTGSFAGSLEALLTVFTPLRVLFLVITAAIVLYEKALASAEDQQRKFADSLTLTGNIAGLTADSYQKLAENIAASNNVTISSSKDVISQLVASGQFQATEVAQFADSAIKLSKLTHTSVDDIVKEFIRAGEAPAQYAEKLLRTTGLVSPALVEHVRQLQEMGDKSEATRVLSNALFDSLQGKAPQALTGLAKLWNDAKVAVDSYIDSARAAASSATNGTTNADILQTSVNRLKELNELQAKYNAAGLTTLSNAASAEIEQVQGVIDSIKDIGVQQGEAAKRASDLARANKDAGAAVQFLDGKITGIRGNTAKMNLELQALRDNIAKAASNPETAGLDTTKFAVANQAKLEAEIRRKFRDETPLKTPEESRDIIVTKATAELDKQLKVYGQIKEVRTALQAIDQLDITLASKRVDGKKLAPLTQAEKDLLKVKLDQIEANKRVESSEDTIYTTAIGPLRAYNDGVTALSILNEKHLLTTKQVTEAKKALDFAYQAATDPLFQYNRTLKDQNDLLDANLGVKERAARQAVQQINSTLAPQGKSLTNDQASLVERENLALQKRNQYQAEYDKLVAGNQGQAENLVTQLNALNNAYEKGVVSQNQYAQGFVQIGLQMNQLLLDKGQGFATFENVALGSIGKIVSGYKNALAGLSETFGSFFTTLTDGFANSIGRAIVYGDNLKDSLLDVARQGVAALISSLVKLGIQYLVNAALGESIAVSSLAATTAASVAAATVTATAWAPAAAAVSLASFGANSIPAAEGIVATYSLTEVLSALSGFEQGGYTGNVGTGQIAGVVHGQEFVVNAQGTRNNLGVLQAMNAGASVGSSGNIKVSIANYGTSKDFEVVPVSADEVRIIARDEAMAAVRRDAPGVVAADMSNPNSKTSKATQRNFTVSRNRQS